MPIGCSILWVNVGDGHFELFHPLLLQLPSLEEQLIALGALILNQKEHMAPLLVVSLPGGVISNLEAVQVHRGFEVVRVPAAFTDEQCFVQQEGIPVCL